MQLHDQLSKEGGTSSRASDRKTESSKDRQ
jgi:hypothetical protein